MARDAVLTLLRDDAQLVTLGGPGFVVDANFSYDQRPNDAGPFMVIVWRQTDFDISVQENAAHHFDVYAHIPAATPGGSTDYVRIDNLLDRCDEIFAAVADNPAVVGGDGWQLNFVEFEGRSMDLIDEGYETICRFASYKALTCKATA